MDGAYPEAVRRCQARYAAGEAVAPRALTAWLETAQCAPVMRTDGRAVLLDLSAGSRMLGVDLHTVDVREFSARIDAATAAAQTAFAFGRWGEQRALYNNEHFAAGSGEPRTVHMGIDLFCPPLADVHAPQDGVVAIVANNARELDYGPLLVLRHADPQGNPFYTLYGHLDLASTRAHAVGDAVAAGARIAAIGRPPENGNWPPHLHFQLVLDLLELGAEFPGVAYASQQAFWLAVSPNPAAFFPDFSAAQFDGRAQPRR